MEGRSLVEYKCYISRRSVLRTSCRTAGAGARAWVWSMVGPIRLTCTARRGPDGMGIDARSGLIVALVPGGTAEEDGLMAVGDTIVAVDGVALAGQRLGNLLPSEAGASCELTLTRTDETFAQQLQCLGLPPHSTYALLRFQVRRSVADGLGVAMQAALVREVTAATSELRVGDVVLTVDGETLGPGRPLHSVLEAGRLVYTFVVARQRVPETTDVSDAPVERTPETCRAEPDGESRTGPWSSSGLVEELQAEAEAARCAVAEMVREQAAEDARRLERLAQAAVKEDTLQLDRLAQAAIEEDSDDERDRLARAAIEEDSDDERDAPRRVHYEDSTSTSLPRVPPLQQPSKAADAQLHEGDKVHAPRAASQVVRCLLAPPPTKNRSEVVMPTVLSAPPRSSGRSPGVVSDDVYNAGTGTWCDLPTSLVSGDERGGEVVWSDIPVGATRGSTTRINTNSNEVDSASHALMAMIEQVLSARPVEFSSSWQLPATLASGSRNNPPPTTHPLACRRSALATMLC